MAHFAKLDENNVVLDVLVINDDDIQNLPFPESEIVGIEYLNSFLPGFNWKQTSYNNNFRVRYAGIGAIFYPNFGEHGGFSNIKLSAEEVFDETTLTWSIPQPIVEGAKIL